MNIENFFEELHEKSWKQNISAEVSRSVDNLIESLQENKDEMIQEIIQHINDMESLKLEEKEEFTYTHFKKWTDKYSVDILINHLEKE